MPVKQSKILRFFHVMMNKIQFHKPQKMFPFPFSFISLKIRKKVVFCIRLKFSFCSLKFLQNHTQKKKHIQFYILQIGDTKILKIKFI